MMICMGNCMDVNFSFVYIAVDLPSAVAELVKARNSTCADWQHYSLERHGGGQVSDIYSAIHMNFLSWVHSKNKNGITKISPPIYI